MITLADIITIDLAQIRPEVVFAYQTAFAKSRGSNTQNTWQKERSPFKKFTDLFAGDLAKNAVRYFLAAQGIRATDYDQIRTDSFKNNDLYDLEIRNSYIEVKSSLEKYDQQLTTLVNKRRIILYKNRPIKDFSVQVFFNYKTTEGKFFFQDMEELTERNFKNKYNINEEKEFVKHFLDYSPQIFLMGYVTKAEAQSKLSEDFEYQNAKVQGDSKRQYIDFYVKNANPMMHLVKHFQNLVHE